MKRLLLALGVLLAVVVSNRAMAADTYVWGQWINGLPTAWVSGPACDPYVDYNCEAPKVSKKQLNAMKRNGQCDPYLDYSCLDTYLGSDFATRLFGYYQLEWGKAVAPTDPSLPPTSRPESQAPPTPQSTPPMPFAEWPYGGTNNIAKTIPNGVDSPLMVALGNTALGHWLSDAHIQIYGWIDPAGNLSSNKIKQGGNFPISYDYTPNTFDLDQAVLYVERVPNEVQNDHFDWGFRLSGIYGVDYRYTTAYGIASYQLLNHNQINGYDFPMVYLDLYVPFLEGLNVRIGRYISIPDIEAQLAPNNYTYAHSLTYTFDNYTNSGIEFTQAVSKNWILEYGVSIGTEAAPWHMGQTMPNLYVTQNLAATTGVADVLYPGSTMLKDPGALPSYTVGVKWTSDDGRDDFNFVVNAHNTGVWGYNNLQWIGFTYYHKFNDYWHIAFETWNIHNKSVLDLNNANAQTILANGGTPFSAQYMPFNAPNGAWCLGPSQWQKATNTGLATTGSPGVPVGLTAPLTCSTNIQTALLYVNYSPNKLNNFSLRTEYFNDPQGQRTGVPTAYGEVALSWQHWFSPQIEVRPEIAYYRSIDNPAFNGNPAEGIVPNKNWSVVAASDLIIHF
jgi:hypothetical protein